MSTNEDILHDLHADMSSDHVLRPIDQKNFFDCDDSQPDLVEDIEAFLQGIMDGPESSAIQPFFNPQDKAQHNSDFDEIACDVEGETGTKNGAELFKIPGFHPCGLETSLSRKNGTVVDTAMHGRDLFKAAGVPNAFGANQSVGPPAGQDRENRSAYCTGTVSGSEARGEYNGHSINTYADTFLPSNLVAENSLQTHYSHIIFDTSPRNEAMGIKKRRRAPRTRQAPGGPHLSSFGKVEKMRPETQHMRKLSKTATTACYLLLSSTSNPKPSERRIRALSQAFNAPLHLLRQWFHKHAECLQDEGVREQIERSTESYMSLKLRENQRKCSPAVAGACAKPWIKDENMPYLCTCCGRNFKRKGDWKKHEELNFPQEFWLCQFVPCETEPMEKQTYLRKDKFRSHLTKRHGIVPTNEHFETCHFLIESEFPRICIFRNCSTEFETWSERVDHITEHMRRPWTFSEWREFDDDTNEEDKLESSGSDTSEDKYGSDTSNNDSDYPDDAPDNGPDGSSRDYDDSFGTEYEPDVDYRSFQTGQSSSKQAQGSGALGSCYNQHYRQDTHILPETSINYVFGSKPRNPMRIEYLSRQIGERLSLTFNDVYFQQSDLETQALIDRYSAGYVNANTETQNTFNFDIAGPFETVGEETFEATMIPQSNLHFVTAMRKRKSLALQLIQLRQLQTEPLGYSIRRFLEDESDPRITRLLAEQSCLSNTRGYQTGFYNMLQHRKSGTSMLLSGNDSLAGLTNSNSLSTTMSVTSPTGMRALGKPRLLEINGNGSLTIPAIGLRLDWSVGRPVWTTPPYTIK
ncbi:MAG: hypothetical protein Q9187_005002 [Circinaria calcarea]